MMLLARAITQRFSNPTNNSLRTSSNTRNQAIMQRDKVNIQSQSSGNDGRNTRRSFVPEEIIEGNNVQNDVGNIQRTLRTTSLGSAANMLLAKQDEAGVTLTDEQNDFLLPMLLGWKNMSSTKSIHPFFNPLFARDNQEQTYLKQPKIINNTIGNDQIDSNIIFDEPNVDVNSGSVEYDNNVQASYELEQLARNAYREAEKQKINAKKNPKLYDASCFSDTKICVNVRDTKDIFDDATKSQNKMENKLNDPVAIEKKQIFCPIDYNKLNALYEDFVSQKELYAEQKYFSSTFIPSENSSNASTETKPSVALMSRLSATSSVRRPLDRDSPLKNSVLPNTKKSSEIVDVSVRTNKKKYVASKNVVLNKKIVTDVDVQNDLKAKDVLCVSCAKNVLIPCHDKCLANYKLNVHSKVRRTLFTTPRTTKSTFEDTTPIVSKTRFSVKTTQSDSLDTTSVVSKTNIVAVTPLRARNKVVQIVLWIVDSGCSKHMTGDRSLQKNFIEKFMGTVCFGNDHFTAITGYDDYVHGNITVFHVYYVKGLGHNRFSVGQFYDGDLEVAFRSNTCYV
ncbi:hypothetical protein Tco_1142064 [Tanacetum coccineum]